MKHNHKNHCSCMSPMSLDSRDIIILVVVTIMPNYAVYVVKAEFGCLFRS